jgi:hypothetical protein|tara:strand:- start:18228 stop:18395 length:168 start_codon:yes stop_codon:yes gene_type:complete
MSDIVIRGISFNRVALKTMSLSECKEAMKTIDYSIVKEAYYIANPKKKKIVKKSK